MDHVHHPEETGAAFLVVRDLTGREVWKERLQGGVSGIAELNAGRWPAGMYSATLIADGIALASTKLLVQH